MGLKRLLPTLVVVTAVFVAPLVAVADSEQPWTFDGGGWGHGIGLSQFGALGQAEDGRDAEQILQYYYAGTDLGSMPGGHWTNSANGLWVGLVSNTTSVDLAAVGGPITFCQPAPGCGHAQDTINPGETWKFEFDKEDPTRCRFRQPGVGHTGYHDCNATIGLSPSNRAVLNGTQYGRGTLRFAPSPAGFHAVVTLDIETYLYGLAEVPSSWPAEALKSQAIIGRSYALATADERGGDDGSGKLSSCGCHLRDTPADQAYAGWSKEDPAPANFGQQWRDAVNDTAGDILTHPQSNYPFDVAKAFYSSSNGGASENNEDVWPGAPIPWLRSVEDQWSADPDVNPLARWKVRVSDTDMATYFGWDRALDAFVVQGPPDVLVRFTGKDNGADVEMVLNGTEMATLLKTLGFGYKAVGSTSTQVRVSPYISAVTDPPGFDDIVGHTFEVAIDWMLAEEITAGCNPPANTLYCPDDAVTRGQMAVFISRVKGLPAPTGDHFADDDGAFYESAANRLFEAGITVGCDDGRFCGDDTMTRGQMAAFLVRALEDLPKATKDHFEDDDQSIFQKAINQIAESKITLGCNPPANDRFCPGEDVTRGQMAAFFRRAWGP